MYDKYGIHRERSVREWRSGGESGGRGGGGSGGQGDNHITTGPGVL